MRGIPLDCDDGIECTVDLCSEPDGTCSSAPDDSRCQAGQTCGGIEGTGCILACEPGVACDPIAACGCVADQACTYRSDGAPMCGMAGTLAHGEPCSSNADCAAGAQCVPLDGSGGLPPAVYGECRTLCRSSGDCPDESACRVRLAGTLTTFACARPCSLVDQTGCAGPTGCHPVGFVPGSANAYADCVVSGDRPVGASCGTAGAVCAAGLICVTQSSGAAICDRICRYDRDCAGALQCVLLVEPLIVGGIEYGVCN